MSKDEQPDTLRCGVCGHKTLRTRQAGERKVRVCITCGNTWYIPLDEHKRLSDPEKDS